jgi:methylphosphotriester-DNA--protein-cysteine methyltransferase
MLENVALPLDLDTLARRAHMSRRTLTRRFREETGVSPMRWLADARIDRAPELLEVTAEPVENHRTAYWPRRPGLSSGGLPPAHRHIGTSPPEYRSLFGHRAPTIR